MATAALAVAGSAQCVAGWAAVQRFARTPALRLAGYPPVTILKPLHGNEPLLEQALATFCAQNYPAFQVVFGVQDAADPALPILDKLRARFPAVDIAVVIDPTPHGLNRKVANLLNMLPHARHDVLVIADSDIHAAPDYLAHLVASLRQPGVGLVTTLYSGLPAGPGLTSWLGAEHINHAFLPGALMARGLGREDCLGATMALTRSMLDRVGGLPALVDHLADDAELGRLVKALGGRIALAQTVPATTVAEAHLPELFAHELRWARTILSLAPIGFAMSCIQYPLFWAALTVGLSGGEDWAWTAFAFAWLVRGLANTGIDRVLGLSPAAGFWCLPLRDIMSITIMLASLRSDRVAWRGQTLRTTRPSLAPGKG
ncbi:MAG: bacteriohopanetetrol glucosamine biosynthesis glycosyltransferase HpnI [Gemmatimonadaceae bacterium]|nr:bacteriohopanetetrol glucosamine biosynthesis glycosyltransferase HpnI [Acetobacteraceae bacterium]